MCTPEFRSKQNDINQELIMYKKAWNNQKEIIQKFQKNQNKQDDNLRLQLEDLKTQLKQYQANEDLKPQKSDDLLSQNHSLMKDLEISTPVFLIPAKTVVADDKKTQQSVINNLKNTGTINTLESKIKPEQNNHNASKDTKTALQSIREVIMSTENRLKKLQVTNYNCRLAKRSNVSIGDSTELFLLKMKHANNRATREIESYKNTVTQKPLSYLKKSFLPYNESNFNR